MKILFSFFILFFFAANALTPEDRLTDESQERRAMNLFLSVKCLVCAGQSVESSNTEFSFEMRKLIRQKIVTGKSDEQIKLELTKEFGENILLSSQKNNFLTISIILFATLSSAFLYRFFFRSK